MQKDEKRVNENVLQVLVAKESKHFFSSYLCYVVCYILHFFCKIFVFCQRVQSVITKLHKRKSQFYSSGKIEGKRSNWVHTRVSTKTLEMSAACF